MTGSHASESWTYTAHNRPQHREAAEVSRRRQGRGRAGLNRPISVGSTGPSSTTRLVAPGAPIMSHQAYAPRAQLGAATPNAPSSTPHRSASPTPIPIPQRTEVAPSHFGRAAGNASTAEEPSPSVAVGSGVNPAPEQRPSSLGSAHHAQGPYYDHSSDQWYALFPQGRTSLPPIASAYRPQLIDPSSLPPLFPEHAPASFSSGSANTNYSPGQGNGAPDGMYGHLQHRWSGQFLN